MTNEQIIRKESERLVADGVLKMIIGIIYKLTADLPAIRGRRTKDEAYYRRIRPAV